MERGMRKPRRKFQRVKRPTVRKPSRTVSYYNGGQTCPPGQHMMPDGTCMQGSTHQEAVRMGIATSYQNGGKTKPVRKLQAGGHTHAAPAHKFHRHSLDSNNPYNTGIAMPVTMQEDGTGMGNLLPTGVTHENFMFAQDYPGTLHSHPGPRGSRGMSMKKGGKINTQFAEGGMTMTPDQQNAAPPFSTDDPLPEWSWEWRGKRRHKKRKKTRRPQRGRQMGGPIYKNGGTVPGRQLHHSSPQEMQRGLSLLSRGAKANYPYSLPSGRKAIIGNDGYVNMQPNSTPIDIKDWEFIDGMFK